MSAPAPMQRGLTFLAGALAAGLAILVAYRSMGDRTLLAHDKADMTKDAQVSGVLDAGDGGDSGEGGRFDLLSTESASPGAADPRGGDTGPGSHLPDGRPPPPLPSGTPRQVRIGVVIVTYAGAQGTLPRARSKKDALDIATKLADDARSDFHASVMRGDNGSADDVGHIPRGVLELGTEYVIFTMPVGTVSELLDTPRGYWIVKRLD